MQSPTQFSTRHFNMNMIGCGSSHLGIAMEYRGFEYTIIQGFERGTWRWSATLSDGRTKSGSIRGKREALAKVERAINKALSPKRKRRASSISRSDPD
jgi:hypothetical protein